ncbi:MAG TPA: hypothetical protein PK788_07650 [Gemmatimonadaceae bacterium]|nr:hypothetical protein [Gemmatimonadaceae bacterium]
MHPDAPKGIPEPNQRLNIGAVTFAYAHDKYHRSVQLIGNERIIALRAFYRRQAPILHPRDGVEIVAVADYYRRQYRDGSPVLTWDDVAWETAGLRVTSDAWEP